MKHISLELHDHESLNILAGEYVMGLLDKEENLKIELAILTNIQLRSAIHYWRDKLVELDKTAMPIEPSDDLWLKIQNSISVRSYPRQGKISLFTQVKSFKAIGVYIAIAASVIFLALPILRDNFMPLKRSGIAVLTDDNAQAGAIVEIYDKDKITVIALADITVPNDKSLQVWTLQDKAVGPISLGLMNDRKKAELIAPVKLKLIDNQLYEITLEPKGGSPINRPTGKILYKGYAKLL